MTTPSAFEGTGLSINIFTPLVLGGQEIGNYYADITSYSHTISSNGGYSSAEITIMGNVTFLEDWLQNGLGRHVVVHGASGNVVWEGYVDQIDVNMGGAIFVRGPLSELANRVSAMYTPLFCHCCDPAADPDCVDDGEPITGTATETPIVENEFSQSKYGIWEKVLSFGEAWREDAEYAADLYLTENSSPTGNPSLSISGGEGELSLKLSCKGYVEWLGYVYNYEDDKLSDELSDIITDILAADPNSIVSHYYDQIDYNPVIKSRYTSDNKTAKVLIDDILTLGGGNLDRWTFGIYANRKAIYTPIPTEVEYIYYKTGRTQQVETPAQEVISPWNVLPCKWVAIPTFLAGSEIKLDEFRNDPRIFFGEEVNYTAPDQVTISGAKVRKFTQLMAQMGLGSE